jgi:hypothetical protein
MKEKKLIKKNQITKLKKAYWLEEGNPKRELMDA